MPKIEIDFRQLFFRLSVVLVVKCQNGFQELYAVIRFYKIIVKKIYQFSNHIFDETEENIHKIHWKIFYQISKTVQFYKAMSKILFKQTI